MEMIPPMSVVGPFAQLNTASEIFRASRTLSLEQPHGEKMDSHPPIHMT